MINLLGILACFFVGAIIFPAQFKIWYLYPLVPMFVVLTAVILSRAGRLAMVYVVLFAVVNTWRFLPHLKPEINRDMKLLSTQRLVVEKVMELGGNEIYGAYTYTEPIYDYPYQYWFWWLRKKTGQGPTVYSYLPDRFDNVINKRLYDPLLQNINTIILILERDNPASDYRWETWLPTFYEYKITSVVNLPSGVRIEKRVKEL